jgi:hypothetical protein
MKTITKEDMLKKKSLPASVDVRAEVLEAEEWYIVL